MNSDFGRNFAKKVFPSRLSPFTRALPHCVLGKCAGGARENAKKIFENFAPFACFAVRKGFHKHQHYFCSSSSYFVKALKTTLHTLTDFGKANYSRLD